MDGWGKVPHFFLAIRIILPEVSVNGAPVQFPKIFSMCSPAFPSMPMISVGL